MDTGMTRGQFYDILCRLVSRERPHWRVHPTKHPDTFLVAGSPHIENTCHSQGNHCQEFTTSEYTMEAAEKISRAMLNLANDQGWFRV